MWGNPGHETSHLCAAALGRQALETGLRSSDAFVLRRCQILLASARGERALQIAQVVGCDDQTVREVIHGFNARGLAVLRLGSKRPKTIRSAFDASRAERLRELLHQSPRTFGKPTSLWTLDLAAEVSFEQGLTPERVSDEQTVANDDPDPKALACYGLLVRWAEPGTADGDGPGAGWHEEAWLRFVDGRPVNAVTISYLGWCCERLEAAGKEALLLIWDNASWHISRAVRTWIRDHNRQVKQAGRGVRIINQYLPIKSPWLNPIEPKWVHGKRRVVEPDRLLSAQELADRVCAAFRCAHEPHLTISENVA
jgi:hypothetical protein